MRRVCAICLLALWSGAAAAGPDDLAGIWWCDRADIAGGDKYTFRADGTVRVTVRSGSEGGADWSTTSLNGTWRLAEDTLSMELVNGASFGAYRDGAPMTRFEVDGLVQMQTSVRTGDWAVTALSRDRLAMRLDETALTCRRDG